MEPSAGEGYLATAQLFFFAVFVVPPVFYYALRQPDEHPHFPATISWQVRAGPPKWAHHVLWGLGWMHALAACFVSEFTTFAMMFHLKMFAAGVVAIVLAPVGMSPRQDKVHHIFALVYMIDHSFMALYWNVNAYCQIGYYTSLALFLTAVVLARKLKAASGMDIRKTWRDVGTASTVPAREQRLLIDTMWALELLEMVFENLLFLFFVAGM